jgi:hypothetical protein
VAPNLTDLLRSESYPSWGVQSLFGFSVLLLDGFSARAANWLSWLLSAGVLIALGRSWRAMAWQVGTRQWDLSMATTLTLGLVISPHLFVYDLMLLLLPFAIVCSHYSQRTGRALLDGGPLLAWTIVLWAVCFFGPYISKGQLKLCEALELPPIAVQLTTLAIVFWAISCLRASPEQSEPR